MNKDESSDLTLDKLKDALNNTKKMQETKPVKDLGEVVFCCKETEQKITVKLTGKGSKISIDTDFFPPLSKHSEVPMTAVLQLFIQFMDVVKGKK